MEGDDDSVRTDLTSSGDDNVSDDVRITEVMTAEVEVKGTAGKSGAEEEDVSALVALVREEKERTKKLMKTVSTLTILFGSVVLVLTFFICLWSWDLQAETIAFCYAAGFFSVAVGVAIKKSYGLRISYVTDAATGMRKLNISSPKNPLRVRGNAEIANVRPVAFLLLSSSVLLLGAISMIYGDVMLNSDFWMIRDYMKGSNLVHAAFSSVFIISSLIGFAFAFARLESHSKTAVSTYIIFNILGFLMATGLFFVNLNAMVEGRASSVNSERLEMAGDNYDGSSSAIFNYPYQPYATYIALKFIPAAILSAFCLTNVVMSLGLIWAVNEEDPLHKKVNRSAFMGTLGLVAIAGGVVINAVMVLMSQFTYTNGYSGSYQRMFSMTPAIFSLLLAGLQAFFGFYSSGNFRRFVLFFLGIAVVASCTATLITVNNLNQDYSRGEHLALKQNSCIGKEDADTFCVYNSTQSNFENFRNRRERYTYESSAPDLEPPPLACIPRSKVCDGVADIIMEKRWSGNSRYSDK